MVIRRRSPIENLLIILRQELKKGRSVPKKVHMRKVTVRLKHHLIKNLKVFKTVYVRNVAEVSTLYFIANFIFALTYI